MRCLKCLSRSIARLTMLTVFLSPAYATHQWARVIGGSGTEAPLSVQQTSDGGYIIAGYTWGSFRGDQDAWLVKLDSSGSTSWQRTFGGAAGSEWATVVRQTADGGYYLGCYSMAFGNGVEAWILRLDSAGSVVWQKTYGGTSDEYLYSLEPTDDGGCVFAGSTTSFGAGGWNAWAVRLSSNGTVNWAKRRYVDQNEEMQAIAPDGSGGYAALSAAVGSGGSYDVWFMRLDSNGNSVNNTRHLIGSGGNETPVAIDRSSDGGWFVAGQVSVPGSSYDGLLMKLDSTGSPLWQRHVGGPGFDYFDGGQSTSDGGYMAVGRTASPGDGSGDIWVVKFDGSGGVSWQKTYGGNGSESQGFDVSQTSDGGYIVTSMSDSYGNANDVLVLRLSSTGEIDPSCGTLVENAALPAADLTVSDEIPISFVANTTVTVATPVYATNNTNAANATLCVSSCQVSCSATVPAAGVVGVAADFAGSATLVDCGGGVVSYSWTFGDGSTSTEQNPTHAYAAPGEYPWDLNVTAPGASPCLQSGSITVSATAVPDLTGAWTSVRKRRSKVKATFSCENIDLGEAASFTVKVYFSKKSTVSKKSKLIKTQTVPSLAAGGVVPVTIKATPPNGYKYLVVVVDSGGAVAESNETNNTISNALP